MRHPDDPVRVGDILPGAAKSAGLDDGAAAGRIWGSWRSIAGEAISDHATPSSLRRGVLRLHADSPSWATEISYLADELKRRINELLRREAVKEVRVWTGPDRPPRAFGGRANPPAQQASEKTGEKPSLDPTEAVARAREAWAKSSLRESP
jgi:hypothetical protein